MKWGAEIPCYGRPDWLKDDDICAVLSNGNWCGLGSHVRTADEWEWRSLLALKLKDDHFYYRFDLIGNAFYHKNVEVRMIDKLPWYLDIPQAIATLEGAGYKVTAPDPYEALLDAIAYEKDMIWTGDALAMLRRAIPDPASIDMAALAKVGDV
jgi:hypothetical protein